MIKLDLIGNKIKILGYSDPNLIGKEGIIVFETRKTFLIQIPQKRITIFKGNGIFEIYYSNKKLIVPGSKLIGKLEKRWT